MKELGIVIAVVLIAMWLNRCIGQNIEEAGNLILKRIDELEEKTDAIQSKLDES